MQIVLFIKKISIYLQSGGDTFPERLMEVEVPYQTNCTYLADYFPNLISDGIICAGEHTSNKSALHTETEFMSRKFWASSQGPR